MSQQYIDEPDDLEWLQDVTGIVTRGFNCAVLDDVLLDRIELYRINHYQCVPVVYVLDGNGNLIDSRLASTTTL